MAREKRTLIVLVAVNILLPALILCLGAVAMQALATTPFIFDYALIASQTVAVVILCEQIVFLSLWTALYDPKLPQLRWIASLMILVLAAVALAPCFGVWMKQVHWAAAGDPLITHQAMVAGVLFFVLSFLEMLLVHVGMWPLRSALGWRILWNDRAPLSVRRFSLADGMIWIGLISAALALSTSFSSADYALPSAIVFIGGTIAAAAIGVPAAGLILVRSSYRAWLLYTVWFLATIIGEFVLLYRSFGFAALPMLSWRGVPPIIAAINGIVLLVGAANSLALRKMGAKLVVARRSHTCDAESIAVPTESAAD